MVFLQIQFPESIQFWIYWVLIWIGFGILVGLVTCAIFPGEEPKGPWGVLLIGVLGATIGPFILKAVGQFEPFQPISPLGMVAAITGASVLLVAYRFLLVVAAEHAAKYGRSTPRRRSSPSRGGYLALPPEDD